MIHDVILFLCIPPLGNLLSSLSFKFGRRMFEENCSFCADIINELIKNGKEVEAVYFASESGLTEQFPPVSLLKSSLQNANSISKKVNFSSAAVVS